VQDYCKSDELISLKLDVMIGPTDWKTRTAGYWWWSASSARRGQLLSFWDFLERFILQLWAGVS